MKLRADNIIHDAVERAVADAIPYAIRRWYKHRDRCIASALVEHRDFQEHVAKIVQDAVNDALAEVIDFDAEPDDVPCITELPAEASGLQSEEP